MLVLRESHPALHLSNIACDAPHAPTLASIPDARNNVPVRAPNPTAPRSPRALRTPSLRHLRTAFVDIASRITMADLAAGLATLRGIYPDRDPQLLRRVLMLQANNLEAAAASLADESGFFPHPPDARSSMPVTRDSDGFHGVAPASAPSDGAWLPHAFVEGAPAPPPRRTSPAQASRGALGHPGSPDRPPRAPEELRATLAALHVKLGRVASPRDPGTALLVLEVARCYDELGQTDEALAAYSAAFDALLTAVGPSDSAAVECARRWCRCLCRAGKAADAMRLLENLLPALPGASPAALGARCDLAACLRELGDLPGAVRHYQLALAALQQSQEPRRSDLVTTMLRLGECHGAMGNASEAELVLEAALEAAGGPGRVADASVWDAAGALVGLRLRQGRGAACLDLAIALRAAKEAVLGSAHPDVVALAAVVEAARRAAAGDARGDAAARAAAVATEGVMLVHRQFQDNCRSQWRRQWWPAWPFWVPNASPVSLTDQSLALRESGVLQGPLLRCEQFVTEELYDSVDRMEMIKSAAAAGGPSPQPPADRGCNQPLATPGCAPGEGLPQGPAPDPQGQDRVTKVSTTDAGGSAGAGSSHGGPRGSAATVAAALLSYMDHVMKDLDLAVQARCDLSEVEWIVDCIARMETEPEEGMMESLQDAFRENLDRIVATVIAGGASSSSRSSSRSGGAAAGDGHAPALNLATLDDVVRETRSVEHALGRTRLSSGGEGEEGVEGADGTATVLARSHGALLEVLQLDFPSATRGELRNALEAAGDDVDMARDLLRDSLGVPAVADAVTAAGAGAAEALLAQVERVRAMAREQGVELTEAEVEEYKAQFRARMAGVAGQDAAPAPSGATDDEHAAKMAHLAELYPTVATDSLKTVLQTSRWDVSIAQGVLQAYGYVSRKSEPATPPPPPPPRAARPVPRAPVMYVPGDEYRSEHGPLVRTVEAPRYDQETIYRQHRAEAQDLRDKEAELQQKITEAKAAGKADKAHVFQRLKRRVVEKRRTLEEVAGQRIFRAVNERQNANRFTIDLHGLHVREAVDTVQQHLKIIRALNKMGTKACLVAIVGRGLHSQDGEARLKPSVCELLDAQPDVWYAVSALNPGALEIQLRT